MTRKNNIDLAKFIIAVVIMLGHASTMGLSWLTYPFSTAYIFVEMYLIITGYFTVKHFDGKDNNSLLKGTIKYSLKKFIPLYPYFAITTIFAYVVLALKGIGDPSQFQAEIVRDFVIEMLMLKELFAKPLVGSLWYISALFIMFPFFVFFCRVVKRPMRILVSLLYPLLFYCLIDLRLQGLVLCDLLRVMAGLMLGGLIFDLLKIWGSKIRNCNIILLTLIEAVTFAFSLVASYKNLFCFHAFRICIFVFCFLALSGFTYSAKIQGNLVSYLGRLSMPLYIIHWEVGEIINYISQRISMNLPCMYLVFLILSITTSALLMFVIEKIRESFKRQKSSTT